MSLALAAEVLHALLVDAPADDLGSPAASEAAASITETVVQRLEDLVRLARRARGVPKAARH